MPFFFFFFFWVGQVLIRGIKRTISRLKHVTYFLFLSIAVYAAVYGVSYAYLLHHLANVLAAWMVGIYFFSEGFPVGKLWCMLEGDETSLEPYGGNHVKKKP